LANGVAASLIEFLGDSTPRPPPRRATALAGEVAAWLTQNEGATFSLYFGNMAGLGLYAVSLYPERSVVVPRRSVDSPLLRRFVEDNADLLSDPRNGIGVWYSEALDAVYLDVSAILPSRQEAVALGERYNQEAIYDLALGEVIDTGGTGEQRGGWAEEADRLPPLSRTGAEP
jgi:hypothetical protein